MISLSRFAIPAAIVLSWMATTPSNAAAATTCLCRSGTDATFKEVTVRHHRWACDIAMGYVKVARDNRIKARPTTQTCNKEEVVQYKVWRCMQDGCTYPYARSTEELNPGLEIIEPLDGKRTP